MSGSRVFLDLSDFFSDVRQQSCIFLDYEKNKLVKDVEDHIRRVFGVDRPFHILNDGWLLPSSESSLILRDNDTVSIVPEGDPKLSKKIGESKDDVGTKTQEKGSKDSEVTSLIDKFKRPANINFPAPNSALTNKNGKPNGLEKFNVGVKNPFATLHSSTGSDRTISVTDPKLSNVSSGELSTAHTTQDQETASECESGERKRKRIRRRKKKSTDESVKELKNEEKKQSPYIMNKYFQGVSHILKSSVQEQNNKKHIFFNDEEESKNVKVSEPAVNSGGVQQSEPLDQSVANCGGGGEYQSLENSGGARDHHVSPKNSTSSSLGDLSKLMALGNQKSPVVFERKKSENPVTVEPKVQPPKKTTLPSDFKLTPLTALPVKETIIKFQILKMVNYSPTLSDMITARVISPDFTTNQLFVQITEGLNELQSEKGKFSLDVEEGEEEQPLSEYLYLNWHDLLHPKAVEYC